MSEPDERSEAGGPAAARGEYASSYHAPVLAETVARRLVTDPDGTYVDATLGGGGHAAALLDALSDDGRVIGTDRDEEALAEARERLPEAVDAGRLTVAKGNFARLTTLLNEHAPEKEEEVDGVLLDLGISSRQLDAPERGFSFQKEGPLDMRFDAEEGRRTAAQIVRDWPEDDLKQLFYDYGEEPRAPQVARTIVEARQERSLETTEALAEVVRVATIPPEETKTLARVFQALRIAVNGELEALESALRALPEVLREDGRVAVIGYHSLEDRRAKRFLRYGNFEGRPVRDLYGHLIAPLKPVEKGPLTASEDEIERNPRARSARLRIAARRSDDAVDIWRARMAEG
ncbi:MAG: 16S rRNA (cytosine(1402)-N(4))-methyltransferase [Bacteroidetes bacterium QS_8_68_15]|nr:MAG: 16S rRNA (cytosine(1402)-N(4))-methyltransferase [Bacteroidetes bacterium QS_8_68_15]